MPQAQSPLDLVLANPAFRAACAAVAEGKTDLVLSGLTRPAKALVLAGLAHEFHRPLLVLTADNQGADELCATARTFLQWLEAESAGAVATLPAFDCIPYENRSPHPEILERRAAVLWSVAQTQPRILFVPLAAALGRFREKRFYASLALEIKVGDELDREDLVDHLTGVGYEPAEPVGNVGQFSVRGGIIDIYSPEAPWPVRLEFFGDQVESLREFDPATQRSRASIALARLLPLVETRRSPKFFETLVEVLSRRAPAPKPGAPDWQSAFMNPFPGWEFFISLVEPHPRNLTDLLDHPLLVWDEPGEGKEQGRRLLDSLAAAFDEVRDMVPPWPEPKEIFLTEDEFNAAFSRTPQVFLQELDIAASPETLLSTPPRHFFLRAQPPPQFQGSLKALTGELQQRLAQAETVLCVLPTAGKIDRLRELLNEYQIPFTALPLSGRALAGADMEPREAPKVVLIAQGDIRDGVIFPEPRLALLADRNLFGDFEWVARDRRTTSPVAGFLSDLSDLKVGDYVVHVDHGIGLYQGLRQLEVDGAPRDFMLLVYQDDAKLYVPLERLDLVEKYRAGGEAAKPALARLGGTSWERTKTRVKRSLRDMAQELLRLYAERKMQGGVATSPDTPWQKEFEETFEFEETPDQLRALEEIKRDLEGPEPMDRLLCGDVGYGKTELAVRAAFKVVQDGRQVAVLTPTTVLAFQHYTTFRQRLAAFPVRVEMLSRFRTPAEQKYIVAETEIGKVDILIGTHRLLSKDVRFRELGLLIVDEEQRFGVAAKEKLKKWKASVDVLTLSATPIPRTLHMSIGGLRDLSVIETPPRGRLAIQTIVAPFSPRLIQSAILQELERQGQVFYIHNRVESIFEMAASVQRLVPAARLGVAHGQMAERELERAMLKFVRGGYDVLVSTALIENGLDIPRANTMIIDRADYFGLADLYQLRGRVGRSNRRAYAYCLIPAEGSLTPTARNRLAALKEFSDLGAGFRLAALDLELRGAGNLLGREQHGHLHAVGIDFYLRLLEQTVEELKGAPAKPEIRMTLNLGLDIKIPDSYIADESQRLRMYKQISTVAGAEAQTEMEADLIDRYGPIPPSVFNLLRYARLKSLAEQLWVQTLERKGEEIRIRFAEQAPVDTHKLTQFMRQHREATFRPDGRLRFRLSVGTDRLLAQLQNVLQQLHAQA
jgi:transcription-repair coupling factor (superfamily II helicase)